MRNLAEMFRDRVRATPDKPAVTFQDKTLTWGQVFDLAWAMKQRLDALGVGRGDVVGVYCEHSTAQVVALFGTVMADAAFTIINPRMKREQVLHQVSDCDARVIVATPGQATLAREIMEPRGEAVITLQADGLGEGEDMPPTANPDALHTACIPTDVACLIYTSGSTGRPKGVVLPHRTLTDGARIVSGYLGITDHDTLLCLLPFGFDYGLNQLLTVVYKGARAVLFSFAFPKDLFDILEKEKVTAMAAVPSLWPRILDRRYAEDPDKPVFEHLRYVTTAGGPHSEGLLRRLTAFFPKTEIIIMYGLTESFRSTFLPFKELFNRIGSIGKAVPEVEILVLNEDGQPCRPGEKGELYHRGAFVSYGYLNNPDLTAAKFVNLQTGGPGTRPEPAVRSGDVVSLDEDGFIYFHGRADSLIKCKGYRVSPGEVEGAALAFPGIRHAAAYGVPHPEDGQAVIVAYDTFNPIDADAFKRHLRQVLPYYAVPQDIRQMDSIPLTVNGKVDYGAVRAAHHGTAKEAS